MIVTIDRFEGNYAVCEDKNKKMINIEKSCLPDNATDGDILIVNGSSISIDVAGTLKRKAEVEKLMKDMWN